MRRQTRVGIIIKWSERSEHGSSNTGANKADRADRANPTGQYWFDDTMGSGLNEGYHEWHSWGFGGIGIPIGTGIGFNLHILILILVLGAAMAWQYNAAWMKGITSGACVQPEQWPVTIHGGVRIRSSAAWPSVCMNVVMQWTSVCMQWSSVFKYMRAQKWVWLVCCQLGTKCFSVTHTGLSETTWTVVHRYFGFSSTKIRAQLKIW